MTRLRVDFGAAGMDVWTRIPSSNIQNRFREEGLFAPQAQNGGRFNDLALSCNLVRAVRVIHGFPKTINLRLRRSRTRPSLVRNRKKKSSEAKI
jgi:hypothetical protein